MKTIYVTVAEFLENGGELEVGRAIYNSTGSSYGCFTEFDYNYEGVYIDDDCEYSFSNLDVYVKIPCTPIYK